MEIENKLYFTQVNDLNQSISCNKLSLNSKTTKYILLRSRYGKEDNSLYYIKIGNIDPDRIGNNCSKQSTKFLGLHSYENLTRWQHNAAVRRKVSISIHKFGIMLWFDIQCTWWFIVLWSHMDQWNWSIFAWFQI